MATNGGSKQRSNGNGVKEKSATRVQAYAATACMPYRHVMAIVLYGKTRRHRCCLLSRMQNDTAFAVNVCWRHVVVRSRRRTDGAIGGGCGKADGRRRRA